jgi:hypothetical protein
MGLEAHCTVRQGTRSSAGRAQLEEKELVFRGDFRLKVPLADVTKADAKGGTLTIAWKGGQARLDLGAAASRWAEKIKNPRGLLDKLGVKPESRVAVIGLDDPAFLEQVRARTSHVAIGRAGKGTALVVVAMKAVSDLRRLAALRRAIEPDGAIWVVWPKGVKAFREDDVRAAGPSVGLVDVKVVSFSETLSGLKMVVPRALRGSS